VDQPEQDVLGAEVVVVEHPGLFLSQDDDPPRAVGEALEHDVPIVRPDWRAGNRSLVIGPTPQSAVDWSAAGSG
jgi:hypothetical protein